MWSTKAVCFLLVVVAQVSAIPVLPLSAAVGEKLADTGRTFIINVQDAAALPQRQPEQMEAQPQQQEQKRDFPWPYPPQFAPLLLDQDKQRLIEIYADPSLSSEERMNRVNGVFDRMPQEVIQSLPLPVEYERLPADVYKRIYYIHTAAGFKWAERQQLIQNIVESLPDAEKQLMHTPRFGGPPPRFEDVLPVTIYKQLLFVHYNPALSKEERSTLITRIMRQVPAEQIQQLPLPQGMDQLPFELQQRVRSLVYDYSVEQPLRAQRVREFVQQLPDAIRPALR